MFKSWKGEKGEDKKCKRLKNGTNKGENPRGPKFGEELATTRQVLSIGPEFWHNRLSLCLQHPMWALVPVLAASLLTETPYNGLGKAAKNDPSVWDPTTNVGNPDDTPGYWIQPGLAVWTPGEWTNRISLSVSLSWFCNCDFQISKQTFEWIFSMTERLDELNFIKIKISVLCKTHKQMKTSHRLGKNICKTEIRVLPPMNTKNCQDSIIRKK